MAISDELNRIIQAKADIRSALGEKGLVIGESSTLDEYPALIQEMEVGGGGDVSTLIDLLEGDVSGDFVIPNGTTQIGENGLSALGNVNVIFPDTVNVLTKHATYMSKIKRLDLYDTSITNIYQSGLEYSQELEYLSFPKNLTVVPSLVARGCTKLKKVIIPASVRQLAQGNNFQGCSGLEEILILSKNNLTAASEGMGRYPNNIIYFPNEKWDLYKSEYINNKYNQWYRYDCRPIASMSYNPSTYTVQATGRDNLELYVDASLCNSSVYTFTQGASDTTHTVMVKSVDPSLGVLDTSTMEVTIQGSTPTYSAAAPTYTVGNPTYTWYAPSNCYKINVPVTFTNGQLQGYEGQYTTNRLLGSAQGGNTWYSDFDPIDDPNATPTMFYRYYYLNDTNTTLHLHNSVVVVYKDGNNEELYRTDAINLDASIVTDYQFDNSATPYIDIEYEVDGNGEDTGYGRIIVYIGDSTNNTQYVNLNIDGIDSSNPTSYAQEYYFTDGWETTENSAEAEITVIATAQEPGKLPTTKTFYVIGAQPEPEPEPEQLSEPTYDIQPDRDTYNVEITNTDENADEIYYMYEGDEDYTLYEGILIGNASGTIIYAHASDSTGEYEDSEDITIVCGSGE